MLSNKIKLFRWFSGQPDNKGGNDLNILAEGCTGLESSGIYDASCSIVQPFLCEYRFDNKTTVDCPTQYNNNSVLGCGWYFICFLNWELYFLFVFSKYFFSW